MNTKKNLFAALGVGALMTIGFAAAGSTPASADGLRIGDHNGHISVAATIGNNGYNRYEQRPVVVEQPVYVQPAPVYVASERRNDNRDGKWLDRDHRKFGHDRNEQNGKDCR